MDRVRFCQRCFTKQVLIDYDHPRPCRQCGGTNFDAQPPQHHHDYMTLTPEDADFLRCQRIDPETESEWWNP